MAPQSKRAMPRMLLISGMALSAATGKAQPAPAAIHKFASATVAIEKFTPAPAKPDKQTPGKNQRTPAAIDNATVLRWYRERLPAPVMVARIEAAPRVGFDLSTPALERLQHAGLEATVLAAMIRQQNRQKIARRRARLKRQAAAQRKLRRERRQQAKAARLQRLKRPNRPAPASMGFFPAIMPLLARIQGFNSHGQALPPTYGFILRRQGVVAAYWPRRAPEAARVLLGDGAVYDKTRLLGRDARRRLLWLRLPARRLAALESPMTLRTAAMRPVPMRRNERVYLLRYGRPRQLRNARAAGQTARQTAGQTPGQTAGQPLRRWRVSLVRSRLGAAAGARRGISARRLNGGESASPGSPVFDRHGRWLGMAVPGDSKASWWLLARGDLEAHTRARGRRLAAAPWHAANAHHPARFYIEDRTGHNYGARLAAELEKHSRLRQTWRRRAAQWVLVLTLSRGYRRRTERLEARRAAAGRRRVVWSGEARILLFRHSAARRLADEWLKSRPAGAKRSVQ